MAILNYTTTIDAHKTVGEIHKIISRRGAGSIFTEYDSSGNPVGLSFSIDIKGSSVNYKMPANYRGVKTAMAKDPNIAKSKISEEQAIKVAWRILKDWIEAQMAIVDAELALMEQVFLPYAIVSDGQTLFEKIKSSPKLLTSI